MTGPAARLRWLAAALVLVGAVLLAWGGFQLVQRWMPPVALAQPTVSPVVMPPLPPGAEADALGRLTAWPGKKSVPCPEQTPDTAVILVLGQSNAGNHGQTLAIREPRPEVLNWQVGGCTLASSPLLGATGQGGEPWTLLADQLVKGQQAKQVVIAPLAVTSSGISRWVPGGDIDQQLVSEVRSLQSLYRTTHVVWVQGETDFGETQPEERYRSSLLSVVKTLRSLGVRAPVHVSVATRCNTRVPWTPDNGIARAQASVVSVPDHILAGVNMDALLGVEDRYDGCHLNTQGLSAVALAWAQLLIPR
ncbi:MAG: sialate O-acetylesterase [Pseudomonadota bacterium]